MYFMHTIQYTIRNIPPAVDRVIRKRSRLNGTSFNQTVVDLLVQQTGGVAQPGNENFSWLYNQQTLDNTFDETLQSLSMPDKRLWH